MKYFYLVSTIAFLGIHFSTCLCQGLGGSNGMPPKYLSIKGHRECLSSHFLNPQDTFKSVCIPKIQPQACLEESWSKLKELAGNGKIGMCNSEEKKDKTSNLGSESDDSCEGRCGESLDPNASCQCNDACTRYGDCCDDYETLCLGSCVGRCEDGYDETMPCQCNDKCEQYNNCCADKEEVCGHDGTVTDDDLRAISEELIKLDDNNAGSMIQTNPQGKTNSGSHEDHAPEPLFTSIDDQAWSLPTIEALLTLLDNYDSDVKHKEDHTSEEQLEEDAFLSLVMETRVMKKAYEFCFDKGLFSGTVDDFKNYLKTIWFGLYDRGGSGAGSSGFEHVFIGEIKSGEVSGFHDWVNFYQQEKTNAINYLGYIDKATFNESGSGISDVFTWNGDLKSYGSMFIGTSPELVMALDTICFLARPDNKPSTCSMSLNSQPVYITTWTLDYNGETYIGSAYPDWA